APAAPPAAVPASTPSPPGTPGPAGAPGAAATQVLPPRTVLAQYCLRCPKHKLKSGGLSLAELNLDAVYQSPEIAEKVIRKLRAGLMPPAGVKRPDSRSVTDMVSWLPEQNDIHEHH